METHKKFECPISDPVYGSEILSSIVRNTSEILIKYIYMYIVNISHGRYYLLRFSNKEYGPANELLDHIASGSQRIEKHACPHTFTMVFAARMHFEQEQI